MEQETKNCQNCKKDFIIEPDDFSFYKKIKIPPPTFCPECRMIRRMIWRNHRSLCKRNCDVCNKSLISMYNDTAPVCCTECWNSDKRDQFKYGREYDTSKTFFNQWSDLLKINPRLFSYKIGNSINSDYVNYSLDIKNVYLSYSVINCEDVMYSESVDKSKVIFDCYGSHNLDSCYYNVDCEKNYNTHYAVKSSSCIDSCFIFNCINCQNCILSSNLRNKQYLFKNEQYTKEEYEKIVYELRLNTYDGICSAQKDFDILIEGKNTIHKFAQIINSQNITGDNIENSRNIKNSFNIQGSENVKHSWRTQSNTKDCFDVQAAVSGELMYEVIAGSFNSYKTYFCFISIGCRECEYSFNLKNCQNCFGCCGLVNSSYCILNKQYSKEEYFEIIEKIKIDMNDRPYTDSKGRIYKYGEFFPFEISPFGYNETNAQDFFNLKKEEAINIGMPWKSSEARNYKITIKSEDLPNSIFDISNEILDEVISCPNNGDEKYQCVTAYRIMPEELQFYQTKKLPLPRYCPNCRHHQRLKYRNPLKLWHRSCMKEGCTNEFETSYSPDRPEIVYCESCYKKEVY